MNDVTVRRPVIWNCAGATDVGTVRPLNEDAFLVQPEIGLWTVADGMGGHDGGSVASQMIVDELKKLTTKINLDSFIKDIEDAVLAVNQYLLNYSKTSLNGRTIGSTFVSLLIKGNIGVCLWAGDSRLYRLRHDKLIMISHDHSHVAELVKEGLISEEEAATHPESNVITRAVGTSERLDIDIELFDVNVGDQFLLCSDGLYNAVPQSEIISAMNGDDLEVSVQQLIENALQNKATDNISVILVKGLHQNV
ncbi:protein phosphatase 2C domain-containing protein [Psychromonas sp.]|nr:protein phosphatase 2C domain-containing protein [Psychromonas sp.]